MEALLKDACPLPLPYPEAPMWFRFGYGLFPAHELEVTTRIGTIHSNPLVHTDGSLQDCRGKGSVPYWGGRNAGGSYGSIRCPGISQKTRRMFLLSCLAVFGLSFRALAFWGDAFFATGQLSFQGFCSVSHVDVNSSTLRRVHKLATHRCLPSEVRDACP